MHPTFTFPPLPSCYTKTKTKGFHTKGRCAYFTAKPVTQNQSYGIRMGKNIKDDETLDDFDRDYYDEMKEKYAHMENVRIFSKDDYDIDPSEAPWYSDYRGRDISAILEKMKDREIPEDFHDAVLHQTDLHTPKEIDEFEKRMRTADSVNGRTWIDPMPESDFDLDPNWIDLRKIPDELLNNSGIDDENIFDEFPSKPLIRKQYGSTEEEIADMNLSFSQMQLEHLDFEFKPNSPASVVDTPSKEDFAKWQTEAEKRGGNSTVHEAYFLSPYRQQDKSSTENYDGVSDRYKDEDIPYPKQHESIVQAHQGSWEGVMHVFSLTEDSELNPKLLSQVEVRSEANVQDGILHWNTTVDDGASELISLMKFSSIEFKDALACGRGVSGDGSYISMALSRDRELMSEFGISLSHKFLVNIIPDVAPVVEFCVVSDERTRSRIILCTKPKDCKKKRNESVEEARFSEIIFISESKLDSKTQPRSTVQDNSKIRMHQILGEWEGKGLLLHPEFPSLPYRKVDTVLKIKKQLHISDEDVTWVEKRPNDRPEMASDTRKHVKQGKKPSKRVLAARNYDRKRLSTCSFLSTQNSGIDMQIETFAWRAEPSEIRPAFFYSPRTGKFIFDYCSVPLFNKILVTFPVDTSCPDMWHVLSVTEMTKPYRKRLVAGRNELGELVGALFISEVQKNNDVTDAVSSYV